MIALSNHPSSAGGHLEQSAQLPFALPLLGVETVRAMTGLDEDAILGEVLEGRFRWAWNVGINPERTNLRVWAGSVESRSNPARPEPDKLEDVLRLIFPRRSWFTGVLNSNEVKDLLNVSPLHVVRLLEVGLLTEHRASCKRSSRGPCSKRLITRESVTSLLSTRRMPL